MRGINNEMLNYLLNARPEEAVSKRQVNELSSTLFAIGETAVRTVV